MSYELLEMALTIVTKWPEIDAVRAGILELLSHHVRRVAIDNLFDTPQCHKLGIRHRTEDACAHFGVHILLTMLVSFISLAKNGNR